MFNKYIYIVFQVYELIFVPVRIWGWVDGVQEILRIVKMVRFIGRSLKGWIFVVLQVLKLLSIAREPWTILKQVFYTLLPRALAKWNTLQSSSIYTLLKKKCNFPCCVSFEEECIVYSIHVWLVYMKKQRNYYNWGPSPIFIHTHICSCVGKLW